MIKLTLHVAPRIVTLLNLPEQGSFYELMLKRQIRSAIDFKTEDAELFELKSDNGNLKWNAQKDLESPFEVEFNREQIDYLIKIYSKLDEEGKLTESVFDFVSELFSHKVEENEK